MQQAEQLVWCDGDAGIHVQCEDGSVSYPPMDLVPREIADDLDEAVNKLIVKNRMLRAMIAAAISGD